jgi:hypothetical protein
LAQISPPEAPSCHPRQALSDWRKYPGELEGQRPSSAEEEAKADDKTKDMRASAQFENRPNLPDDTGLRNP